MCNNCYLFQKWNLQFKFYKKYVSQLLVYLMKELWSRVWKFIQLSSTFGSLSLKLSPSLHHQSFWLQSKWNEMLFADNNIVFCSPEKCQWSPDGQVISRGLEHCRRCIIELETSWILSCKYYFLSWLDIILIVYNIFSLEEI